MADDENKTEDSIDKPDEQSVEEMVADAPKNEPDNKAELSEKEAHDLEFTNNAEVDKAVDQIVNEESDELMDAQDDEQDRRFEKSNKKKSVKEKIKSLASAWWNHRKIRYGTFVVIFLLLAAGIFVPSTRYGVLNLAGVRVESSMTVVDSNTGLPLENIKVTLQGQESVSDSEGSINFSDLKLGSSYLVIEKIGFAKYEKNLTLGWGSNPLGPQPLSATGTQFTFVLSDWLSDQTIQDAEASSGENIATSDESGKITLIVGDLRDGTEAVVKADGYREEVVKLEDITEEENIIKLVPAKKHVFVSNRSGEYDLYKIDVDGKNEEVLLPATGKEREVPFVLPHQTRDFAAYISSREGEVNKDKFVLDGLFIIDVNSGDVRKITRSEQLQIIGWIGDKLVYVAVIEGVSAGNSQRSRIFSYDVNNGDKKELAASNYFNDVKLINGKVYYGISSYAVPQSAAKLFTINPDGTDKNKLVDTQVWSIIRADFDTVWFNAINLQWFEQEAGQDATKLDQAPANRQTRLYTLSPDGSRAVWVDIRDGKGVLLNYDIKENKDTIILTEAGLGTPVYWLANNYVIYRKTTTSETADYILNLDGGEPKKISDVLGNRSRYFY